MNNQINCFKTNATQQPQTAGCPVRDGMWVENVYPSHAHPSRQGQNAARHIMSLRDTGVKWGVIFQV